MTFKFKYLNIRVLLKLPSRALLLKMNQNMFTFHSILRLKLHHRTLFLVEPLRFMFAGSVSSVGKQLCPTSLLSGKPL